MPDNPTSKTPGFILSLVERGWQAARLLSLDYAEQGTGTLHIVKGRVPGEVRAIVRPVPGIRLAALPKTLFWPVLWLICAGTQLTGRLRGVIVDNERSEKRVRSWLWPGIPVVRAEPRQSWYDAQDLRQSA